MAADVLGSIFAVLAIGMGSVYACLGLYNQVVEWRPNPNAVRRFAEGAAIPVALFAVVLWMLATGRESFAEPLGYVGTLTAPLLGGIFPMLLVSASRRRGELVPGTAPGFIGTPVTAVVIAVLFFAGVVLHGTLIGTARWSRSRPLPSPAGCSAVAFVAWRGGAFRPRSVIELRREPERDLGHLGVTVAGVAAEPPVDARRPAGDAPAASSTSRQLRHATRRAAVGSARGGGGVDAPRVPGRALDGGVRGHRRRGRASVGITPNVEEIHMTPHRTLRARARGRRCRRGGVRLGRLR